MNFCVPTTCDGCALGYYFDQQTETCQPYDDGDDGRCPNGYFYDTGQQSCVPYTPGQTTQGCWTVSVAVPNCTVTPTPDTRCPQGYRWDESEQTCQRPERGDEEDQIDCSPYTFQNTCQAAGCSWTGTGTPPNYGFCHN